MSTEPSKTPRTDAARRQCKEFYDQGGSATAQSFKDKDGDCVPFEEVEKLELELSTLKKCAKEMAGAFHYPAITAGNAESLSWHLSKGAPNGGVTQEGLENFLSSVAKQCKALDAALTTYQNLMKGGE